MMEMVVESMEIASRGHFPVPAGCQNRDLSPKSWVDDDGGCGRFRGISPILLGFSFGGV